jgi:hypothetical protein
LPIKIEERKPNVVATGVTSPMRRSSVDLADFFHKPLTNSSQQPKKKKFGVDDFIKIK